MEIFYDMLNRKKIGIAKALQETQKKFIHSEEWKHPFYWSGFVVIGAKK